MFRRGLPEGPSRGCLDRLSNRLTKMVAEARKIRTPGEWTEIGRLCRPNRKLTPYRLVNRSSNVAFYATTFPEQWLETIGVLGRTMHCSGSTRRLETQRRRCASRVAGSN